LEEIGTTYKNATLSSSKITVSCSDEKTGIQALSHIKTEPMKSGRCKRIDPEYKRNGTSCLIAARNVKSGMINTYSLGGTRKEEDYLEHVKSIVTTNPDGEHIIICDQLNTHKSASLVEWIAEQVGYIGDLGTKRRKGILGSVISRMEFLENKNHRIRFLYTPKHCSWMNQIENWFGLLEKKVIKNGEFNSTMILEQKIMAFISYFNICMARPYNWKSLGEKYSAKIMN
jgi:transposase